MRVICSILLMAAALCSPSANAAMVTGVRAVVNDSVITYQQVEDYSAPFIKQLRELHRNEPEVFQKKALELINSSLEQLINRQLILHDFKSSGFNIPEPIMEDIVQERIQERYSDRIKLTKSLQEEGLTYEAFRQQVREQFIIEQMGLKFVPDPIVSPQKVESYYVANRDKFKLEDQVKLRMIVMNRPKTPEEEEIVKRRFEEILTKVREGASFAEMATIYSEGSQKSQGGDWGWVEKSVLRKELADVAFTLKKGERSGIIETPESFYLMQVDDTRIAYVKSLGEVRDEIEKNLILQERSRLHKQWMDRLRKKTFVRYF